MFRCFFNNNCIPKANRFVRDGGLEEMLVV